MRFLVAESETASQRQRRREHVGQSSGESYADALRAIVPDVQVSRVTPADADAAVPDVPALERFDAVFVTGSPLHVYDDTPETRRQLDFMSAVFASGTPAFGSCAGLQLAVAAAGGTVGPLDRKEAGLARRIGRTEAGRHHPLLAGRGVAWDAPSIHGDAAECLPPGAACLATNAATAIQAVEIVHGRGMFWGVQYHPELSLAEIGAALRRQAGDLVDAGLALTEQAVADHAGLFQALHDRPDRVDLRWRLGVDDEVVDPAHRRRELANFVRYLVLPTRERRAAGSPSLAA